jgi:hypothetical protein
MAKFETSLENGDSSNSHAIKLGEIRRAVDMELIHDSRLVVVLEHNRADDSYLVALVSNLIDVATSQDLLFPSDVTGAAFDISILPEFSTRIWKQQIDSSPLFGTLPKEFTNEIIQNISSHAVDLKDSLIPHGEYEVEFADHVWVFRGKEIDALNLLGHSPDKTQSNLRFFEIWRETNIDLTLTDIILENDLGIEILDNFLTNDSIRLELV